MIDRKFFPDPNEARRLELEQEIGGLLIKTRALETVDPALDQYTVAELFGIRSRLRTTLYGSPFGAIPRPWHT